MDSDWLWRLAYVSYIVVLGLLCVYGLHRYVLVALFYAVRRRDRRPPAAFERLPHVTVQLPMYNERYVARRVIEQACRIDYPRDRLEIQVLDDSTDDTQSIAREAVARLQAAGHDIVYLHRDHRTGYKAGALDAGLNAAQGEFVAIFDADFLPPENLLRDTIQHFTDPGVGMVQTRWEHLNRDSSLLTRVQAVLLDGHFMVEHTARNRSGRFMSFNGTGGVWRKTAIENAGGWEHDTLTEDLDLSYRAQLNGWRFVFVPTIVSPAELPPEINAFKAQQHRWTKGGAQTCLKLLPKVLRSAVPLKVKIEAVFHLTSAMVYILTVLLSLLIGPAMCAKVRAYRLGAAPAVLDWEWFVEMTLLVVGAGSAVGFYIVSQRGLLRNWRNSVRYVPALMAVGIGISLNNAIAAIEGFAGHQSEFVRTPKVGDEAHSRPSRWRNRLIGFRGRGLWQAWVELVLGLYLAVFLTAFLIDPVAIRAVFGILPFMLLFVAGYLYVAINTLCGRWLTRRPKPTIAVA